MHVSPSNRSWLKLLATLLILASAWMVGCESQRPPTTPAEDAILELVLQTLRRENGYLVLKPVTHFGLPGNSEELDYSQLAERLAFPGCDVAALVA